MLLKGKYSSIFAGNMDAIYTSCTVNHLSRAFSLLDSVHKYHPQIKFIICLVDVVDRSQLPAGDYDLVCAEEMRLPFFREMYIKYATLELNSALKPYFASFLLDKYQIDRLIYLDSDILLFNKLEPVFEALQDHSIVITPHSMSTVESGFIFDDRNFLRSGIYNAGFFAVRRDKDAGSFLDWWMKKLRNQGFFEPRKGMFAEQLWMNLIPLYFNNVLVLRHKGCNVAYWNLHEREVIKRGEDFFINNNETPLIFFHFSGAGMDCFEKNNPSVSQDRYTFTDRPDIVPVFEQYLENLRKYAFFKSDSYYTITDRFKTKVPLVKPVVELVRKIIKKLIFIR